MLKFRLPNILTHATSLFSNCFLLFFKDPEFAAEGFETRYQESNKCRYYMSDWKVIA
jgi:hypothetical protein